MAEPRPCAHTEAGRESEEYFLASIVGCIQVLLHKVRDSLYVKKKSSNAGHPKIMTNVIILDILPFFSVF